MPGKAFGSEPSEGTLEFRDGEWIPDDPEELKEAAEVANMFSNPPFYSYSPADGSFGFLLALKIAKALNGKPNLLNTPPGKADPNIIF